MRLAIPVLSLMLLAGCASTPSANTPEKVYVTTVSALDIVQRGLIAAHKTGVLSDRELLNSYPYILAARDGVAVMKANLPAGGSMFDQALAAALAAIQRLQAIEAEASARKVTHGNGGDSGVDRVGGEAVSHRGERLSGNEGFRRFDSRADCEDRGIAGRIFGGVGRTDCRSKAA